MLHYQTVGFNQKNGNFPRVSLDLPYVPGIIFQASPPMVRLRCGDDNFALRLDGTIFSGRISKESGIMIFYDV